MEMNGTRYLSILLLIVYAVNHCVYGDDSCPATSLTCNCNSNSDDLCDLRERVTSLENAINLITDGGDLIRDCSDVTYNESGIYQLSPRSSDPFEAQCIFDEDGNWTVIQQRADGGVSFNRAWVEYKQGFGDNTENGSFWLGLENMHRITRQRQYTLRIDLMDWNDTMYYAEYALFSVGDEASQYVLALDGHCGTLPEALIERANGSPFSTVDQDNDAWGDNCAKVYATGWWHLRCYEAQLNGPYRAAGDDARTDAKGIIWRPLLSYWYSMKYARMRTKPAFIN